ncbi:hypothetical protein BHE74_00055652 [Ensete ventricosum]|nr:hypothetical protein BHE74_00055652 [Ensete ventricosum]
MVDFQSITSVPLGSGRFVYQSAGGLVHIARFGALPRGKANLALNIENDFIETYWSLFHYNNLVLLQIADALYYNPSLTLGILHKLGVATEVFNLWFQMLQEVKKSGMRAHFKREHDKKVCCLGLTSLLGLPGDQLPGEAFERVFKATLELLVSYKDQVAGTASQCFRFSGESMPFLKFFVFLTLAVAS